ncbi:MAG: leucine-rich repeat domain-containing protein [Clostridia bacterium]|nr:leucine-rich repeat domain-containing protein [Clostridia bacterium]
MKKYDDATYKKFFVVKKNELCGFITELKNEHWWQSFPLSRGEYPFIIEVPAGVTTIKENAFSGLKSTTNGRVMVVLPEGVTTIEKGAFSGCEINKLLISDTVKFIDKDAFRLSKIGAIEVDKTSPNYKSVDGSLFDREMTTIIRYGGSGTEYEVPGTVSVIGKRAFENSSITSVYLGDGVVTIEDGAFYNSAIKQITLSASVSSLGQNAFAMCRNLSSFIIPYGLSSVSHRLFYGCASLESVTIPETVTTIGTESFLGCQLLRDIEIPNEIQTIGKGAFEGCKSLKDFPIPSCISEIAERTFKGCNCFTDVIIPSNIERIGAQAFASCKRLRSVNIGINVNEIGEYAFLDCQKDITIILSGKTRKEKLIFDKKWNLLTNSGLIKRKIKRIAYKQEQ